MAVLQFLYMKILLLVVSLFLFPFYGSSQKLSLDLYGGLMNYMGDLQNNYYTFKQSHLAGGLGLSYSLTDHIAVRSVFTVGKVSADDRFSKYKGRNLNFTTQLTEFQLGIQYYIFPLAKGKLSPYVFASADVFHFNPYTHDTAGVKYYLEPLSTEGQGFIDGKRRYKLTQFAIPIGGGIKYSLNESVNVGVAFGLRKLFTDYLDDISSVYVDKDLLQKNRGSKAVELAYRGGEVNPNHFYPIAGEVRGSPNRDWFYFTSVTISFRFPKDGGRRNGFSGSRRGRPDFGCPPGW